MKTIALLLAAIGLAATALGAAVATPAAAKTPPAASSIDARRFNQQRRIDAGRRSGSLTYAEAARLKSQQAAIRRYERRLRAAHGGRLTRADRRAIHLRQDRADANILANKRNPWHGRNRLRID